MRGGVLHGRWADRRRRDARATSECRSRVLDSAASTSDLVVVGAPIRSPEPGAGGGLGMDDRILREPEVARLTGLGRTTRYLLERSGSFPRRRKISHNAVGWIESEVLKWLRSREVGAAPPPVMAGRVGRRPVGTPRY